MPKRKRFSKKTVSAPETYLLISDLQIPFEHQDALEHCKYLKKHFKVKDENVINVGDETDQYFGGLYKKSPEALHTPNSEISISIDKLLKWYDAFPEMKLATSNHGTRYWRKALDAEIPQQLLRKYSEVIQAPPGWKWKKRWLINGSRKPFLVEHGDDWGGQTPHLKAALHNGVSTAMGHHHSKVHVSHLKTAGLEMWAAVLGSMIDFDQYAFEYARRSALKPVIGSGIVVDGGQNCFFIPI